jgi:hypothetical protein
MGRRLAALVLCVLLLGATGLAVGGCGRRASAWNEAPSGQTAGAETGAALQDVEDTLDQLEAVLGRMEEQAPEDLSGF